VSDLFCEERREEEEVDVLRSLVFRVLKTQRGERDSHLLPKPTPRHPASHLRYSLPGRTGHYGYKQHGNADAM